MIGIEYNILNLPSMITFSDRAKIGYAYNADGEKLQMRSYLPGLIARQATGAFDVATGIRNARSREPQPTDGIAEQDASYVPVTKSLYTETNYCGNMVYRRGQLSQIQFDGGYVTMSGSTPRFHYYLQDHLGNNRVVVNQDGEVEQVNHYYPFGGLMDCSTDGGVQKYKFGGKELERTSSLNWYDFEARWYDPVVPLFTSIDPLCEEDRKVSPYVYCRDNPVNAIDPDGRKTIFLQQHSHINMNHYPLSLHLHIHSSWLFQRINIYTIILTGQ